MKTSGPSLESCFRISVLRIPENEEGESGRTLQFRGCAKIGLSSASQTLQRPSPEGPTCIQDTGSQPGGSRREFILASCHVIETPQSSEGRKGSRCSSRRKNSLSRTQTSSVSAAEETTTVRARIISIAGSGEDTQAQSPLKAFSCCQCTRGWRFSRCPCQLG